MTKSIVERQKSQLRELTMIKSTVFRRAVVVSCSVAIAAGAGLYCLRPTQAQQPIRPNLQPNLQLKIVPKLQLQIPAQLQTHLLATKLKIAPAVLDKQFLLKADIPFIKLDNGEEKALIPLALMESAQVNTDAVPEDLQDYAPYIRSDNSLTLVRKTPFKLGRFLIPTVVDHRAQMTPIRDQGPRGTCVAHAANAALEVFPTIPDDLSEQYSYDLFMRKEGRESCYDKGIKTTDSANYLADGTVTEANWAYTNSLPGCSAAVPAAAANAQKYKISSYQLIEDGGVDGAASIKNPRYLESALRAGRNIVLGTHVAWSGANADGILDVVINSATNQPAASRGGHAMLICGFDSSKKYFIVKNSWGAGWQHSGYGYLSYDYIRTYAKYGYYIKTVSPAMLMINPGTLKPGVLAPGVINRVPRVNR